MIKTVVTKSGAETRRLAKKISQEIKKSELEQKHSLVIGLIGELGSGKTIFAKGFAEGLGIKENITSPTFVIEKIYRFRPKADPPRAEKTENYKLFVHIDAYRIEKSKELVGLGFKDLVKSPYNIVLIEWADRIKNILPKNYIKIEFRHVAANKRKIIIDSKTIKIKI